MAIAPAGKRMSLSDVINKEIKKKVDTDSYTDLTKPVQIECIPTGSLIIDKVLGVPGVPRGRITEIFGPESTGKTTLAQSIVYQCQQQGGVAAYLDLEQAFNPLYAQKMGIDMDPNKFALFQPNTFEDTWLITRELIDKARVDLLVIDSVSGMTPRKILEADIEKDAQIGLMARMMSMFMAEMSKKINGSHTAMVLINQFRSRIKQGPYDTGPDQETSGGRALKYYCTIRLELKLKKTEKIDGKNPMDGTDTEIPVANIVSAINRKNKIAIPYKKADFVLRLGEGIDNVRSVIDIAENLGLLQMRTGGFFRGRKDFPLKSDPNFMNEVGEIRGREAVRAYLMANEDQFQALLDKIYVNQDETVKVESEADEVNVKEVDINALGDQVIEEVTKPKSRKKADKKAVVEKAASAAAAAAEEVGFDDDGPATE